MRCVLTKINASAPALSKAARLDLADMQLTAEQLVKTYGHMCTIRPFEERAH